MSTKGPLKNTVILQNFCFICDFVSCLYNYSLYFQNRTDTSYEEYAQFKCLSSIIQAITRSTDNMGINVPLICPLRLSS